MIQLRNGATASDRRLGRIPRFDPRSRAFSVRDVITDQKPRSYTYAKIDFDTMRALLADQGEAAFFIGRHSKPKTAG